MAKSACVKPSHGWMDQTKTGLSPMRLLFMSCVKPKVNHHASSSVGYITEHIDVTPGSVVVKVT